MLIFWLTKNVVFSKSKISSASITSANSLRLFSSWAELRINSCTICDQALYKVSSHIDVWKHLKCNGFEYVSSSSTLFLNIFSKDSTFFDSMNMNLETWYKKITYCLSLILRDQVHFVNKYKYFRFRRMLCHWLQTKKV